MSNIDTSEWFYEFTYNGERKRIHKFAHLPFDLALKMNQSGATDEEKFAATIEALLDRDCGLHISDFDSETMTALIGALSEDAEGGLGE